MPASRVSPLLASTLLSQEKNRSKHSHHQWKTGIPTLDDSLAPHLWTSGKVIGIIDDSDSDSDSDSDTASIPAEKQKLPLTTQLITAHLASIHNSPVNISTPPPPATPATAPATVFTITPVTAATTTSTSAISPTNLATALESASLPPSLLDTVSLLQYFDFAGLADAVAEVSSTLSQRQQDGQAQSRDRQPASDSSSAQTQPSILALEGLTPSLTALTRSSGLIATNALLAPLLRSLTHLSRTQPGLLVVLLLEVEVLDLFSPFQGRSGGAAAAEPSAFSSYSAHRRERRRLREHGQRRGGFPGRGSMNGGSNAKANSALASVLAVLASGVDELVLVHTLPEEEEEGDVVEVLFDRVGDGTGRCGVC